MSLPELTLAVFTYRRPWYGLITLQAIIRNLDYAGPRRYIVADGGSSQEELDAYHHILRDLPHEVVVESNLADQWNAVAHRAGELWWTTMDDFMPHQRINLSPDARFLLENPDIGAIRMGRLAFWEHGPGEEIFAQLRMRDGLHWWVIDKGRTSHPYICCLNTFLYHRRFHQAYGDIPKVAEHVPGEAEVEIARLYNQRPGPTVAVPMRFGQDCGEWDEPIKHFGAWRSDSYTEAGGRRY